MTEKKNKAKSSKDNANTRRKRGKSAVTKKLDVLKKILKDGAKEHKDAIDKVIQQYNDYVSFEKLEKDFVDMKARLEAAKIIKENEAERKKAEEVEKLKAEKLRANKAKSKESK